MYCAWHTHGTISGTDIKYSFVGNPDRCLSACAAQTIGPNGNAGADGMASLIAHELEESVTDPDLNAWYDQRGKENADKCAWTFGNVYKTSNGAFANMLLGGKDYLIQRNWVNASGGYCAIELLTDVARCSGPAARSSISFSRSGFRRLHVDLDLNGLFAAAERHAFHSFDVAIVAVDWTYEKLPSNRSFPTVKRDTRLPHVSLAPFPITVAHQAGDILGPALKC